MVRRSTHGTAHPNRDVDRRAQRAATHPFVADYDDDTLRRQLLQIMARRTAPAAEEGLFELLGRRSEGRQQWIGLGQDGLAGREQRCDHRERGLERRHHRERLRGERPEEGHERGEGGDTRHRAVAGEGRGHIRAPAAALAPAPPWGQPGPAMGRR